LFNNDRETTRAKFGRAKTSIACPYSRNDFKFKLSQIKTPGSWGPFFYINIVIINFKIEFLCTRNGNVVVIVISISNGDSV
jgi:hypothetical protein